MSSEEKTETVVIGRPVEFENVAYGKGTYKVTPRVAQALRARNATASVASHMAIEKAKERGQEGGGDPSTAGVIIGGKPGEGGGEGGAGGTVSQPSTEPPAGGSSDANSPEAVGGVGAQTLARDPAAATRERVEGGGGGAAGGGSSDETARDAISGVESLTGELPKDFPARDKLAKGNPDEGVPPVTHYEQLTTLSKEQLDKIPGVGEKTIEEIGQRLFADAQKASGGGGAE